MDLRMGTLKDTTARRMVAMRVTRKPGVAGRRRPIVVEGRRDGRNTKERGDEERKRKWLMALQSPGECSIAREGCAEQGPQAESLDTLPIRPSAPLRSSTGKAAADAAPTPHTHRPPFSRTVTVCRPASSAYSEIFSASARRPRPLRQRLKAIANASVVFHYSLRAAPMLPICQHRT